MSRHIVFRLLLLLALTPPLASAAQGLQVIVAPVRAALLADRIEALGTLRANESAILSATTTDTIAEIRFNDGQRVSAGQVLVVLNRREQLAERAEARAAVEEAQRQYERVQDLARRGTASASLLDQRRRELRTAQARLEAAEARVLDRQIVAPFDGAVGLRTLSVGSLLTPGTPVTTLHDDSVMKLDFTVPELFIAAVLPGQHIEAQSRAFPGEVFRGLVTAISNQVDPVTRAFVVRAEIPNPERRLRPGMLLTLQLQSEERETLLVPEEALLSHDREHTVFVVESEDGADSGNGATLRAVQRPVRTGTRVQGAIEIRDGLSAGERVVTHGAFRLSDGEPIRIRAVDDGRRPLAELLVQPADGTEP